MYGSAAAPLAEVGEIRGIWVENKPDLVIGYASAISTYSQIPCRIEIAENAHAARAMVEAISPDSLVVDIKLDSNVDGISFVKQLRRNRPILPVRFVSSYLDEYEERLRGLDNVAGVHSRLQLEDDIFASFRDELLADAYAHRFFQHYKVSELSWDGFLNHPWRDLVLSVHARLFAAYIRGVLMTRGLAWAAVCGHKIVASSKSFERFPSLREKEILASRFGRVPFVYTQPISSEEGLGFNDPLLEHYPRMIVEVEGREALADFDTGTNRTIIPESLSSIEPASVLEPGTHLGKPYRYAMNKRKIGFRSAGYVGVKLVGPVDMAVAIVKDWKSSPWTIINPERGALVGRDALAVGKLRVEIDPRDDKKGVRTLVEPASAKKGR